MGMTPISTRPHTRVKIACDTIIIARRSARSISRACARMRVRVRVRARAPAGRSDDPALKTRFSRRAKTDPRENRSILSRRFLFRNDPQTPYRPKLNCKILPQKIKLASAAAVGRVWQRWLEEGGAQTLRLQNKP